MSISCEDKIGILNDRLNESSQEFLEEGSFASQELYRHYLQEYAQEVQCVLLVLDNYFPGAGFKFFTQSIYESSTEFEMGNGSLMSDFLKITDPSATTPDSLDGEYNPSGNKELREALCNIYMFCNSEGSHHPFTYFSIDVTKDSIKIDFNEVVKE